MEFVTIKGEAKYGYVTEWRLRQMLKEGVLEKFGFYAGSRFYINHTAFVEWLKEKTSGTAAE